MNGKQIAAAVSMCTLAAAGIGMTLNTAGIFYTPVAEALHCGRGAAAFTTTIMSLLSALTGLFLPGWIRKYGLKKTAVTASLLLILGTLLCAAADSLPFLYVCSVIRGIGSGMAGYVTVTLVLSRWFYEKRGLVTGIAMAFSGIPGVLFSSLITHVNEAQGWRMGYVLSAVIIAILCIPCLCLKLSLNPEEIGSEPYGMKKEEVHTETAAHFSYGSPVFILTVIASLLLYMMVSFSNHLPSYAVSIGKSAAAGAEMLSAAMACNIISKVLYGEMADHIGWFRTFLIMNGLTLAGWIGLSAAEGTWLLVLSAGLFAFTFSVSGIGIPLAVQDLFGLENYARAYPAVNLSGGICNAIAASLAGMVYDVTGSYAWDLRAGMISVIVSTIVLAAADHMAKQKKAA